MSTTNNSSSRQRCTNPACPCPSQHFTAAGLCNACHQYLKRTGETRTAAALARSQQEHRQQLTQRNKSKHPKYAPYTCTNPACPSPSRRACARNGLCRACEMYRQRHGYPRIATTREKPVNEGETLKKQETRNRVCANKLCPQTSEYIYTNGLCKACYAYQRIHGHARTAERVAKARAKNLEAARVKRQAAQARLEEQQTAARAEENQPHLDPGTMRRLKEASPRTYHYIRTRRARIAAVGHPSGVKMAAPPVSAVSEGGERISTDTSTELLAMIEKG